MGKSWDRKAAGWVSDAIPNELSKTNSFSKYIAYIPYVGQFAKAIWNGGSALDRFGETYSNDGSLMDSAQYGMSAFQDTAGDPNKYSEKNDSFSKGDGWLKAGKIGEALPGGKGAGSYTQQGGNLLSGVVNMATDKDSGQSKRGPGSPGYNSNSFDLSSFFGSNTPKAPTTNQYQSSLRTSPAGYQLPSNARTIGQGGGDINGMISNVMSGLSNFKSNY